MRIVAVNGSGRVNGNTAALLNALLAGAREAGAETTLLQLGEMTVAPCDSCRTCKQNQTCVIRDDMDRFYELAPEADVVAIGSPIYLDHVTAQTKAFIDRLYCYLGPNLENYYPNRKARAVVAITYGAGDEHAYDYVLDWLKARLKGYFGIETVASLAVHSTVYDPPIGPDHSVVQRARELGRRLAAGD